jgi:hypothetical protein
MLARLLREVACAEAEPVILASARKHGVADEDMLHVFHNPLTVEPHDDGFVMVRGVDRAGNPLEIGVVGTQSVYLIVHALRR